MSRDNHKMQYQHLVQMIAYACAISFTANDLRRYLMIALLKSMKRADDADLEEIQTAILRMRGK